MSFELDFFFHEWTVGTVRREKANNQTTEQTLKKKKNT